MPSKQRRQAALADLIRTKPVSSQLEIVRYLRDHGFEATQASVSRDLRELGLVKLNGHYLPASQVSTNGLKAGIDDPLDGLIIKIEPVGANLVIVHTVVGAASAVAASLDQRLSDDVAGTIAGDDTIFIAVRSRAAQGRVVGSLRGVLSRKAIVIR